MSSTFPPVIPLVAHHDASRGQLRFAGGGRELALACQGMVVPVGGHDAGCAWAAPRMAEDGTIVHRALSSAWESKELLVTPDSGGITVRLRVRGRGAIDSVVLFAGLPEGFPAQPGSTLSHLTWSRREWSRCWRASPLDHRRVFNPQPDGHGHQELPAACAQRVTNATTFGPERFNTFFAPCIAALVLDGAWCLGLVVEPGNDGYTHLDYQVGDGWGLVLHFDGHTVVDGEWTSPGIRIARCRSADHGLTGYVAHLRACGVAPAAGSPPPDWIRRPMLCTWGQQTAWAHLAQSGTALPVGSPATPGANGFAGERSVREIVRLAEAADLPFGVLTIDAGWSAIHSLPEPDPRLWKDLRGFIAEQHARGRKVLLWLGTWNPTGLPEELRMAHDPGLPDLVDPTCPAFRRRLAAGIRACLSPEGLDADGFKLDYTGDMPRGAGYRPAVSGRWGLALLRDYLGLIHCELKAAKSDAVLQTHCASPYLADLTECLRLNDLFAPQPDMVPAMEFRARMAAIANPEAAIDCDGDPFCDRAAWLDYQRAQPRLGIPSLYTLTHMSFPGSDGRLAEVRPEDLAEIAALWGRWLAERAGGVEVAETATVGANG